jgi:hypothetical protein
MALDLDHTREKSDFLRFHAGPGPGLVVLERCLNSGRMTYKIN